MEYFLAQNAYNNLFFRENVIWDGYDMVKLFLGEMSAEKLKKFCKVVLKYYLLKILGIYNFLMLIYLGWK